MADSDRRVVRAPLRSATKRRKKELDKVTLATRLTLKNQKGRWDRPKTVLKIKDSDVAEIIFDTFSTFSYYYYPRPSASFGIGSIPGARTFVIVEEMQGI